MRAPILALAIALLAVLGLTRPGAGAPTIVGNTNTQGRTWAAGDSIVDYNFRRPYSFYLVEGVNGVHGEMDSVIAAWRNGGAVPKFRRMQHLSIFQEGGCSAQELVLDFFTSSGTSANNHFEFICQMVLDLPVECDSIHVKSDTGTSSQDIELFAW